MRKSFWAIFLKSLRKNCPEKLFTVQLAPGSDSRDTFFFFILFAIFPNCFFFVVAMFSGDTENGLAVCKFLVFPNRHNGITLQSVVSKDKVIKTELGIED